MPHKTAPFGFPFLGTGRGTPGLTFCSYTDSDYLNPEQQRSGHHGKYNFDFNQKSGETDGPHFLGHETGKISIHECDDPIDCELLRTVEKKRGSKQDECDNIPDINKNCSKRECLNTTRKTVTQCENEDLDVFEVNLTYPARRPSDRPGPSNPGAPLNHAYVKPRTSGIDNIGEGREPGTATQAHSVESPYVGSSPHTGKLENPETFNPADGNSQADVTCIGDEPPPRRIKKNSGTTCKASDNPSTVASTCHPEVDTTYSIHNSPCDHHDMRHLFTPQLDPEAVAEHSGRVQEFWPHTTQEANTQFPDFCKLYQQVKSYNLPNALGAKITVPSGLNLHRWEDHLRNYHDREICAFLRYGWPVGFTGNKPPVSVNHNHPSGLNYKDHIYDFIQTELSHKAIVGPFTADPFSPWMRKSPIMSRPKKDSNKRRIIIDLSFPGNEGVNGGIDIHSVLGRDISYSLPNIWDLTEALKLIGHNAWIWVADLQRAYRQLRVDPLDAPLLGLQVDQAVYVDLCPSFGCRSSSAACQRTSNAISYLMRKQGYTIYAYLDDFAGCEQSEQQAQQAYAHFTRLLEDLGLQLAREKCQKPTQHVTWLGYTVDTRTMEVSIPASKIQELHRECEEWENRHRVTKKMLQSFIGKVLHAAACIRHARKFTACMLMTLRNMGTRNWTTLTNDCRADVMWFRQYAAKANGIMLYQQPKEYITIECDACLTGAGGNSDSHYYMWTFTDEHRTRFPNIHQLEAVNILVALRTLIPTGDLRGRGILVHTDNISSSFALTTGKTKDITLAACAREIWLEGAIRDVDIKIVHKPSHLIPLADALSRVSTDPDKRQYAETQVQLRSLLMLPPVLNDYSFFDKSL